ncbi:MAG: group 1 truncated hemoglobin [Gammaproteobacteria bacterium]
MARSRTLLAAALGGLFLSAGSSPSHAEAADTARTATVAVATPGSLYERLGGADKVSAFVDDTIDRVAADPRMNQSFDKVNLKHVKDMLLEQICSLAGGGCKYTGDTMRDVHAGHHISNAEFFQLVEVLRDSMREHGVALSERNELLQILAPMKRDVVER